MFRLTADDIRDGAIIPLSFVKFKNVSSLTVSILIIFGWFRSLLVKDATNNLNTFVAKILSHLTNLIPTYNRRLQNIYLIRRFVV